MLIPAKHLGTPSVYLQCGQLKVLCRINFDIFLHNGPEKGILVYTIKGTTSIGSLKQQTPKASPIGAGVMRVALQHLRTHVMRWTGKTGNSTLLGVLFGYLLLLLLTTTISSNVIYTECFARQYRRTFSVLCYTKVGECDVSITLD